jgi:hypothetical protein
MHNPIFAQEVMPQTVTGSWWELGAVMGLIIVLYTIIDKVIVPLIAAKNGGGKKNGDGRYENENVFKELNKLFDRYDESYRHRIRALEHRLERSEEALNELRNAVSEIGNDVSGACATLKFIIGKF